jgi:hypothetical protein
MDRSSNGVSCSAAAPSAAKSRRMPFEKVEALAELVDTKRSVVDNLNWASASRPRLVNKLRCRVALR